MTSNHYILLLHFSSLVSKTIPEHREYQLHARENKDYRRRLLDVITELEKLKPEVQKQVHLYNRAYHEASSPALYNAPSSYSSPSSYSLPSSYNVPSSYNLPSSYNSLLQLDTGVAWPPINRSQSFSGGVH